MFEKLVATFSQRHQTSYLSNSKVLRKSCTNRGGASTLARTEREYIEALWGHQRAALGLVQRYLSSEETDLCAVIQMPTGAGKTAIISHLARCVPEVQKVLILSPSVALKQQIAHEIREGFWRKMDYEPPERLVKTLTPSTIERELETSQTSLAYVCTIQALRTIYRSQEAEFKKLKDHVDLVIFDEGHREPAPLWSRVVRALGKPMVVFTATPYRNDFLGLRTAPEYSYCLPYQQALDQRCIREVEFVSRPFDVSETFLEELINLYNQVRLKHEDCRVIVRCSTRGSILELHARIRALGYSAIAIHESLTNDSDGGTFTNVPDKATEATFWVHQYKLLEGIDDPRFRVLGIYEPLRNARSLVQQVGRIVRNPSCREGQRAYVLCNDNDNQVKYWEQYKQYELDPSRVTLVDFLQGVQSGYTYIDGNYRRGFDISSSDSYKSLNYRFAANIYEKGIGFNKQGLLTAIAEEWVRSDRIEVNVIEVNGSSIVCLFCYVRNSPLLNEHVFYEFELGYTSITIVDRFIFYYDSQGKSLDYLRNSSSVLPPNELQKLLPVSTEVSQVSLLNSDLGRYSIRRRVVSAYSLGETAPSLSDHSQICSHVEGSFQDGDKGRIRRYLGFARGRLTEKQRLSGSYDEYQDWIKCVSDEIKRNRSYCNLLNRFSPYCKPPKTRIPVNVLLERNPAWEQYVDGSGHSFTTNDLCMDIQDGKFSVSVRGLEHEISVTQNGNRYKLECSALDFRYRQIQVKGNSKETLMQCMNRLQSFRLILQDGYIYSHGHHYQPRLGLKGELDLVHILIAVKELECVTEKGAKGSCANGAWSNDSVFGLIDNLGCGTSLGPYLADVSSMVCDDLGHEMADFIAIADSGKRALFIHAKAKEATFSASDFADICSQVVKNLDYLTPNPTRTPRANISKWNRSWKRGKEAVRRIRHGSLKPSELWQAVRRIAQDPSAEKEVWIVFGSNLSRSKFESERRRTNPNPQLIQIYYQLASTWSAVSAVGAKLKVFVRP